MVTRLSIRIPGPGLHEITEQIRQAVRESGVQEGLCTVFIRHTSASLVIQENADPPRARDLERWLDRLVPDGDPLYTHDAEGPDDMPSHVKAALTATSLSIPIARRRARLGTWQGIYLWEHRRHAQLAQGAGACGVGVSSPRPRRAPPPKTLTPAPLPPPLIPPPRERGPGWAVLLVSLFSR